MFDCVCICTFLNNSSLNSGFQRLIDFFVGWLSPTNSGHYDIQFPIEYHLEMKFQAKELGIDTQFLLLHSRNKSCTGLLQWVFIVGTKMINKRVPTYRRVQSVSTYLQVIQIAVHLC